MYGSSGSFLKSRRLSRSIVEVDEDHVEGVQFQQTGGVSVSLSRDSLEGNSKRSHFRLPHPTRFLTS